MAESFPLTLQDKFNQSGFGYVLGDTAIRSSVGVGEDKIRQRYTKAINEVNGTIDLDIDEYNTLEDFYRITLAGGTKTFNFDNPFTGLQAEYRFLAPPSLSTLGGRYFRVRFRWEELG